MSGGFSKSKNKQNSNFQQSVGNQGAMDQMYAGLSGLFGNTAGQTGQQQNQFGQQFSQESMMRQQPAWQKQMDGGAYAGLGVGNQLMDSLQQSQNNPSNMQQVNNSIMGGQGNNYADAMKDSYIQDANLANQNMLANVDARAAASGMSGGARQGVAQARGFEDTNRNLQRNMAETGYNTFDKDLDRKLGIAGQADQNNFGRQQLQANMLQGQQNAMQSGLGYGQNMAQMGLDQQNQPWQQAGQYSQGIGGPTILGSGGSGGSGSSMGAQAGAK